MKLTDLHRVHQSATAALVRYRGALRRLRPQRLDQDAKEHLEKLTENEAILRLVSNRAESDRLFREIRGEKLAARTLAAGAARYRVHEAPQQIQRARAAITAQRRNTLATFPRALDGLDANGMATAELLRLEIFDRLSRAGAAQLLNTYLSALERKDLRGYIEASAIEEMTDGGALVAANEADLPILKALRDHVEGVQELRVPTDLPDFDALEAELNRLESRANLLKVVPLDPAREPHAAEAFEQQQADLIAAGEATDADDQARLRAVVNE